MAEVENPQENAPFSEENEEEYKNLSGMISSNQTFLTQLNLVLILAYLSCSESIDFDEVSEIEHVKDQIAKHSSSGLPKKAKELSEFRAVGRQHASRIQPKMVDCRHNRRM